ncbi:hypothetical protein P5E67_28500, partial [Vibrio parahaemolyticus]|nr:hypothetical protein [Vibrio parahaemolyticus]
MKQVHDAPQIGRIEIRGLHGEGRIDDGVAIVTTQGQQRFFFAVGQFGKVTHRPPSRTRMRAPCFRRTP